MGGELAGASPSRICRKRQGPSRHGHTRENHRPSHRAMAQEAAQGDLLNRREFVVGEAPGTQLFINVTVERQSPRSQPVQGGHGHHQLADGGRLEECLRTNGYSASAANTPSPLAHSISNSSMTAMLTPGTR